MGGEGGGNVRYGFKTLSIQSMLNWSTGATAVIGATLGPFIDAFYGGGRRLFFFVLLLAIGMDWIAGIRASMKDHTYSSEYGLAGVWRTLFILSFPALANLLGQIVHEPGVIFYGITFGILYHTLNSITANMVRAGWDRWVPKWAVDAVASEIKAKSERAMKKKGEDYDGKGL